MIYNREQAMQACSAVLERVTPDNLFYHLDLFSIALSNSILYQDDPLVRNKLQELFKFSLTLTTTMTAFADLKNLNLERDYPEFKLYHYFFVEFLERFIALLKPKYYLDFDLESAKKILDLLKRNINSIPSENKLKSLLDLTCKITVESNGIIYNYFLKGNIYSLRQGVKTIKNQHRVKEENITLTEIA